MSNLESRIEKLERRAGVGERERVQLIVVVGELNCTFDTPRSVIEDYKEASNAKAEAALAEYKIKNPDWETKDIDVLCVGTKKTKEQLESISAGEWPEQ